MAFIYFLAPIIAQREPNTSALPQAIVTGLLGSTICGVMFAISMKLLKVGLKMIKENY